MPIKKIKLFLTRKDRYIERLEASVEHLKLDRDHYRGRAYELQEKLSVARRELRGRDG